MSEPQEELVRRLRSLSEAAARAAETISKHGANGMSSLDNVRRLETDVCIAANHYWKEIFAEE